MQSGGNGTFSDAATQSAVIHLVDELLHVRALQNKLHLFRRGNGRRRESALFRMLAVFRDVIHESHDGQTFGRRVLVVDSKRAVFGDDQLKRLVVPSISAREKKKPTFNMSMRGSQNVQTKLHFIDRLLMYGWTNFKNTW